MTENGFVLYAMPSFLEGVSRIIDFTGSLNQYNISKTPAEADVKAILSDWENVGSDIVSAYQIVYRLRGESLRKCLGEEAGRLNVRNGKKRASRNQLLKHYRMVRSKK